MRKMLATNPNFKIPISLQPDIAIIRKFKFEVKTQFIYE